MASPPLGRGFFFFSLRACVCARDESGSNQYACACRKKKKTPQHGRAIAGYMVAAPGYAQVGSGGVQAGPTPTWRSLPRLGGLLHRGATGASWPPPPSGSSMEVLPQWP